MIAGREILPDEEISFFYWMKPYFGHLVPTEPAFQCQCELCQWRRVGSKSAEQFLNDRFRNTTDKFRDFNSREYAAWRVGAMKPKQGYRHFFQDTRATVSPEIRSELRRRRDEIYLKIAPEPPDFGLPEIQQPAYRDSGPVPFSGGWLPEDSR